MIEPVSGSAKIEIALLTLLFNKNGKAKMWSGLSLETRRVKVEATFQEDYGFNAEEREKDAYYYAYRDFLSNREYDLRRMIRDLKGDTQKGLIAELVAELVVELVAEYEAVDIEWREKYRDDDSEPYPTNLAYTLCCTVGRDI